MFNKAAKTANKPMKKVLALLLAMALILGTIPLGALAGDGQAEDTEYTGAPKTQYDMVNTPEIDYDDEQEYECEYDCECENEEAQIEPSLPEGGYIGIMPMYFSGTRDWTFDFGRDPATDRIEHNVTLDQFGLAVTNPLQFSYERYSHHPSGHPYPPLWNFRQVVAPNSPNPLIVAGMVGLTPWTGPTVGDYVPHFNVNAPQGYYQVGITIFYDGVGQYFSASILVNVQRTNSFVDIRGESSIYNEDSSLAWSQANSPFVPASGVNPDTGEAIRRDSIGFDPIANPVRNPRSITVGRPVHDTHGAHTVTWQIIDSAGVVAASGTSAELNEFGEIPTSVLATLDANMVYTVRVRVHETVPSLPHTASRRHI
ncbi:MAG: hypothetical protein FWG38_05250 [Defluviitaleaceae bacterium]|nr:hypothetical protein [Defluviitaleaceae bacterium]